MAALISAVLGVFAELLMESEAKIYFLMCIFSVLSLVFDKGLKIVRSENFFTPMNRKKSKVAKLPHEDPQGILIIGENGICVFSKL
ncbi:MAG: hypothetical protein ACFFBD_11540 [Candidatus Hodarchaeota archaeon]